MILGASTNLIFYFQWNLCSAACDSLYNFLHRYTITAEAILNADPQIVVLTQILNDSPVFRSVK